MPGYFLFKSYLTATPCHCMVSARRASSNVSSHRTLRRALPSMSDRAQHTSQLLH